MTQNTQFYLTKQNLLLSTLFLQPTRQRVFFSSFSRSTLGLCTQKPANMRPNTKAVVLLGCVFVRFGTNTRIRERTLWNIFFKTVSSVFFLPSLCFCWRPCARIHECAKGIPRGCQFCLPPPPFFMKLPKLQEKCLVHTMVNH